MGWSNVAAAVLQAITVIITGGTPNSGLFVYSATPALGDLIASIAAAAGTDPYGNTYPAGISTTNGTQSATMFGPGISFDPGNGESSSIFADILNPGPTHQDRLNFVLGRPFGATNFAVHFTSEAQDGSVQAWVDFDSPVTSSGGFYAAQPVTNQPVVWSALPLATGWAATVGQATLSYRAGAEGGTVRLSGEARHATTAPASGATIGTLPAGLTPSHAHYFLAPDRNTGDIFMIVVNTSGTVTVNNWAGFTLAANCEIDIEATVALDL